MGALLSLQPLTARVSRNDVVATIGVEEIVAGDKMIVEDGESIAADGIVESGNTAIDEKHLTGESVPIDKGPGDQVFAGSVNRGSSICVVATRVGAESALGQIVALLDQTRQSDDHAGLVDRVGRALVPAVIVFSIAAFFAWREVGHATLAASYSVALAVLLSGCPSALGLAWPAALLSGASRGARDGILVKGADFLERIPHVSLVAFDKTGTLTIGEPSITDIVPLSGGADEVLAIAAAAEIDSRHPLARAIVSAARDRKLSIPEVQRARNIAGVGVEADLDGESVLVGSPRLFSDRRIRLESVEPHLGALTQEGKTVILVSRGASLVGMLALSDPLRPE
ncbi:MAG TPA: HAD-IC family P-type ATPase, partial [Burkholderiales bacterium]|nr:HAD-IC family P-type ATPase [Burkholderiales bacterium]